MSAEITALKMGMEKNCACWKCRRTCYQCIGHTADKLTEPTQTRRIDEGKLNTYILFGKFDQYTRQQGRFARDVRPKLR